jgi:hypothetical protein
MMGVFACRLQRDHSKRWLVQKLRLLHLEFLAVKTPKKGSKCGAKLWLKSSGATLPSVCGFCNIKNQSFLALICWIEPFGGDRPKTP